MIKCSIHESVFEKGVYLSVNLIGSFENNTHFFNDLLVLFLETSYVLQNCIWKKAAFGQSIMQAVRPRSMIVPSQIVLHHHFSPRLRVDSLYAPGFWPPYAVHHIPLSSKDCTVDVDFFWKISRPLRTSIPAWSGVMQTELSRIIREDHILSSYP